MTMYFFTKTKDILDRNIEHYQKKKEEIQKKNKNLSFHLIKKNVLFIGVPMYLIKVMNSIFYYNGIPMYLIKVMNSIFYFNVPLRK